MSIFWLLLHWPIQMTLVPVWLQVKFCVKPKKTEDCSLFKYKIESQYVVTLSLFNASCQSLMTVYERKTHIAVTGVLECTQSLSGRSRHREQHVDKRTHRGWCMNKETYVWGRFTWFCHRVFFYYPCFSYSQLRRI